MGTKVKITMTIEGDGPIGIGDVAESLRRANPEEFDVTGLATENGKQKMTLEYEMTHLN